MNKIIVLFLYLCILSSCKHESVNYEQKAESDIFILLEKAKLSALNNPRVKELKSFKMMDSIEHKLVMEELTTVTAIMLYEADLAIFLTPDCLTKPSELIDDQIGKEKAIQDSIYHFVLSAKVKKLKDTKKFRFFSHVDYWVYQEQLTEILKELRSFCSEEFIEGLEQTKNMAAKRLEE